MAAQRKHKGHSGHAHAKASEAVSAFDAPDAIARRAYELFQERGREPGRALDDWLRAEHEVTESRGRSHST